MKLLLLLALVLLLGWLGLSGRRTAPPEDHGQPWKDPDHKP